MKSRYTAAQVAEWMFEEFKRAEELFRENVVRDIEVKYGKQFTYVSQNGDPAIRRDILFEFRKLAGNSAVWMREDLCWRVRKRSDSLARNRTSSILANRPSR